MIKQSKTTIKELTAQYRAVLKHAFFAGVIAIATTGVASADTTATMEAVMASAKATFSDGSYTPQTWDSTNHTFINGESTTTVAEGAGAEPLTSGVILSLSTGNTNLSAYDGTFSITNPTVDPAEVSVKDKAATYSYTKTASNGSTSSVNLVAEDIQETPVLSVEGYAYAVTTAYRTDSATSIALNEATDNKPQYSQYKFLDSNDEPHNLGDYVDESGDLKIPAEELSDLTLVANAGNALNAYGADTTAFNLVKGHYDDSNDAYKEAVGNANADQEKINTAIANYRNQYGEWKAKSTTKANYDAAIAQQGTYEASLAKVIDGRADTEITKALAEGGAINTAVTEGITNLIDTKEALLSQDIGYDLGNPDDAENGLVARLDALTGAEGEDTSLVGAINANTEAIAQVRSDAEDAWERGEAWIGQELGYDTTTTDANTVLSGAGFTPDAETGKASVVSALIENKTAIANVDGQVGDVKGAAVGLQLNEYGVSQNLVEGGNAAVQFQQIARVIGDRTSISSDANNIDKDASIADNLKSLDRNLGKVHGLITEEGGVKTFNGTNQTASTRVNEEGNYVGNLAVGTTVEDHLVSLDNAIGVNADAIEAEKGRATTAEATLQTAINNETTRAQDADLALQAEINDAVYAAKAGDALTLKSANDYTDAQVDTLEKNISGGVAAATALSAVEVSNVKKGEMSVGGGYGYYNGESAGAFGMAMGLSDNWSVNAGAGVASGDKTQVSFRAGTNYKFKLF